MPPPRRGARALHSAGSLADNDFERLDNAARQSAVARDLAAKRLRDATLVAPFAGIVSAKRTEVGATAAAGTAVLTLVDLAEVHVRMGVAEADVGALRPGLQARVEVPALGRTVTGRVRLAGVAADPASRTYAVKITVPNANRALRAGMVASVAIATGASRAVVTVPTAAVTRDVEGSMQLYVHDAVSGRVRARRVTVGAPLADGALEITAGVAAGEPVVIAGAARLRDGARVTRVTRVTPAIGRVEP